MADHPDPIEHVVVLMLENRANRAVTAPNSGTINLGDSHHHYHRPLPQQQIDLDLTVAEIEILTRLADSRTGS
jgi:hypothetical protein